LKRPTASRPAITIPPRKRRRTTFAAQDSIVGYDEEDTEWALPRLRSFKELSALRGVGEPDDGIREGNEKYIDDEDEDEYEDYHKSPEEAGDGTVIRHNVDDENTQVSQSDAEISEFDAGDLEEELKDLREDLEISPMPDTEATDDEQAKRRSYALRSRPSVFQAAPVKGSVGQATKSHSEAVFSRRDSKAVRFSEQKEESPALPSQESSIIKAQPGLKESSESSDSVSNSSLSDSSDTDSDESSTSSEGSTSESDDDSSSDSESSNSESEDEEVHTGPQVDNPPGYGSLKTKKSNRRNKMRRRLSKLKQLGALPAAADFAALRVWEKENGGGRFIPESVTSSKDSEMAEFEARRQKLLRDIGSGGVDVNGTFNPPNLVDYSDQEQPKGLPETHEAAVEEVSEVGPEPKRRTLDVASTRRLLFGSLGVRTPRTKEDEEATRKKLAGKMNNIIPQKKVSDEPSAVTESDMEEDWEHKLVIRATECIYDDIQLTAPPFPFEQRWDNEAGGLIRQRKGLGKKRKRRQQLQVYDGEENEYGEGDDSFFNGDAQLNYDDSEQPYDEANSNEIAQAVEEEPGDLPPIPNDPNSVRELVESDLKCGCVLAFKQLDVSKATNWQPTVSDYLVAEIHDVYDDNILNLRLAKRDRRKAHELETGEDGPQYSGFEMPGYENEGEDDGFREVSFADLIDPKLLQAADLGNARQASKSVQ
jgi:hypothetical protein